MMQKAAVGKEHTGGGSLPGWAIGPFERHSCSPLLHPRDQKWADAHVYNPAVVHHEGRLAMIYRGETHREMALCLAFSGDSLGFEEHPGNPILRSGAGETNPHDPRLWHHEGVYYLTYNAWVSADVPRLGRADDDLDLSDRPVHQCLATSRDLIHWQRHGVMGIKNGCVVTDPSHWPVRVDGRFLLLGHCGDSFIARSHDLIHWTYERARFSQEIPGLLETCCCLTDLPGAADDDIVVFTAVRPRPPALFALSQGLVSRQDPKGVRDHLAVPFLAPREPWELEGLRGPGVPFPVLFMDTGIVRIEDRWHLYYGASDHVIALATAPLLRPDPSKE